MDAFIGLNETKLRTSGVSIEGGYFALSNHVFSH